VAIFDIIPMMTEKIIKKSISIIVAALNEEIVVEKVLDEIYQCTKDHFTEFEIIAINDGSTDRTGEIMQNFFNKHPANVCVLNNPHNLGLGYSFQKGCKQARHSYVMLLCGDGGLPARSLPAIFDVVGAADLVIPYMTNLRKIKTLKRYLLSKAYVNLMNLLSGFKLRYYNGLPVYPKVLLEEIQVTSRGFGFQGEILVKLLKSGCTFVEIGVEGFEETGNSSALRLKNVLSVGATFLHLCYVILMFKPIPHEKIEKFRKVI
jgi:dolichol-phosphate mannosyltransferase